MRFNIRCLACFAWIGNFPVGLYKSFLFTRKCWQFSLVFTNSSTILSTVTFLLFAQFTLFPTGICRLSCWFSLGLVKLLVFVRHVNEREHYLLVIRLFHRVFPNRITSTLPSSSNFLQFSAICLLKFTPIRYLPIWKPPNIDSVFLVAA